MTTDFAIPTLLSINHCKPLEEIDFKNCITEVPLRIKVLSFGVHPLIHCGNIIHVVAEQLNCDTKNAMVLYKDEKGFEAGKVKGICENSTKLLLRNGKGESKKIEKEHILGRVILIEKNGGNISPAYGFGRLMFFVTDYLSIISGIISFLSSYGVRFCGVFKELPYPFKTPSSAKVLTEIIEKYENPDEIKWYSTEAMKGLEKWEEDFLEKYGRSTGKILNIGCGCGREAFALARMGYSVTGIDISPAMIQQAQLISKELDLSIDFKVKNIIGETEKNEQFDYAIFSSGVYAHIPFKGNRVMALRNIRNMLKPGGKIAMEVCYVQVLPHPYLWKIINGIRKIVKVVFGKYYFGEIGDTLIPGVSPVSNYEKKCYHHYFSSPAEVMEELRLAGFKPLQGFNYEYIVAEK